MVEFWAEGSGETRRVVVREAQDCLLTGLAMNTTYWVKVMVTRTDICVEKEILSGHHFAAGHHNQEQE